MKINIQELAGSAIHIDNQWTPQQLTTGDLGFSLQGPLSLKMTLTMMKQAILGKGEMEGSLLLECSRCLEPFSLPISTELHLRFLPRSNLRGKGFFDLAEKDLNIAYYDRGQIDLDEHIRENLLLLAPMKPLCSSQCKGLCSHCGLNLNTDPCQCSQEEEIDPRLAPLKEWLKDL